MANQAALEEKIIALRERISRLAETSLRINSSLELNVVLQEAADSVRVLTGARYGSIVTVGDDGNPQDFFTSGMSEELRNRFFEWPNKYELFELLREMKGNMRLPDVGAYIESYGLSTHLIPGVGYMAMPLHYRDKLVGNFFLCEKDVDVVFSDEDEEILQQFASLAATAIANARTFSKEQQARADLEALVETSPVGVMVLNEQSETPTMMNQEALKLIDRLTGADDSSHEELLKTLTCRRIDGSEVDVKDFGKHFDGG